MATGKKPPSRTPQRTTFEVSTSDRPDYDDPIKAFVFDRTGALLESASVKNGKLTLKLDPGGVAKARVFLLPEVAELTEADLTPSRLEKLNAYEPVLRAPPTTDLVKVIEIPGPILDIWPICFCLVRGRVVRSSDGRPVCNARVHICEVDRFPRWILKLPDHDIFRLRDDLLEVLRDPPIPLLPDPVPDPPDPIPDPPGPGPQPGPDPAPFQRSLIRMDLSAADAPAIADVAGVAETAPRMLSLSAPAVQAEISANLASASPVLVRNALAQNWKLILPYLCLWPWWWWRFRCDEVAVVTTDAHGRFQAIVAYPCLGDHPDLYFWVEYDFGGGYETVFRPPMACWTHWNYPCGHEVTIRVSDPRVPACDGEGSPNGKEVWVISVGRKVSIGEIYTASAGALEGMVREPFRSGQEDFAFGGKLEPRVWFGRADLIGAGITHYLWSVRPLGGDESAWQPLNRQVIRHYTTGVGTAPVDVMGPEPAGANTGHFRIRPVNPPAGGIEWLVADEREDLATAHFLTLPPGVPEPMPACGVLDPEAGKFELKMELFDSAGNLVKWEDEGINLRVAVGEAPFGTDPVNTQVAGNYHRIKYGGKTVAFRMVLHVDNSRCGATIDAVAGSGIAVNPDCGVVTLTGVSPTLDVGFHAGRPGGLARFDFDTERGLSTDIHAASADGLVDDAVVNGFGRTAPCHFQKTGMSTSTFLGTCDQAAFSEHLRVWALSQDGYGRLWRLDAYDVAAFMLTEPCPPCPPCQEAGGGPGQGAGQGRGQGRGQGQGGGQGRGQSG